MAIRITQSMMYSDMVGQMQKNLAGYMGSNEQGSTQKKINRPSDDPAGTYRVLTTRDDLNATAQYQTNVDTAKGWVQLSMNILGNKVSTAITGIKTLAEQASSGTYTAAQREIMANQVRQYFGELLNYANTEFEGKSLFAGHRYDSSAFEEGLALTSWDDNWSGVLNQGGYSIQGATGSTTLIQFTSDGTLGVNALTYRWSKDGGATWTDATVAAGSRELVADGVVVTLDQNMPVSAADVDAGPGAKNGTLLYIRPTAVYQGDDKDPPPEMTIMGGQRELAASARGTFNKNMLVRIDTAADLNTVGNEFTWSYSTDCGATWVTAKGQTTGGGTVRLPVPGGYMDLDAAAAVGGTTVPAGAQVLIHPSRADLNYEIFKDTYISVNGVGKDIFGGYYQGKPSIEGDANLFEVVGNFIGYLEGNNQEGCQKTLAALGKAHETVLAESTRLGGLENRIEMASDVLSFQKLDQQERLSYTEDIDLTELLTKLTRQQLTYQTVLQSSSMIMKLSLANYV
ncbi:flagellar hook protein [uncultured Desulfovibrio sp.]|uniref:flagellin N-terminal helical domain-containing protein n=1 Tax=uncultured Desulfovibrio sp. TaxID=167968 RepID=UPI00262ABBBE|nr:flagellar hook protein [uncultured Desulfovibrio sp.]